MTDIAKDDLSRRKAPLRKELAKSREAIPLPERDRLAARAAAWLFQGTIWRLAKSVGLYMAIKSEPGCQEIMAMALRQGKLVALPKITSLERRDMDFMALGDLRELAPGPWGILEPPQGHAIIPDLVILPGLGFDLRGARLGYGAGFYDRWLAKVNFSPERLVGFCLASQLVEAVPCDPWDRRAGWLLGENGLLETSAKV